MYLLTSCGIFRVWGRRYPGSISRISGPIYKVMLTIFTNYHFNLMRLWHFDQPTSSSRCVFKAGCIVDQADLEHQEPQEDEEEDEVSVVYKGKICM